MSSQSFTSSSSSSSSSSSDDQENNNTSDDLSRSDNTVFSENPAHIVLLVYDDLGWSDVGWNNDLYDTPVIDSLANSGILLNNYYVWPECTPTRSAMFTGRYTFKMGTSFAAPPGTRERIPSDTMQLAEILTNYGNYECYMVGKWHLGYSSFDYTPFNNGFKHHFGIFQGLGHFYRHDLCIDWETFTNSTLLLSFLYKIYPNGYCGYDLWNDNQLFIENDTNNEWINYQYRDYIDKTISNFVETDNNNNNNNNSNNKSMFLYVSFQTVHTPILDPPENNFSECRDIVNSGIKSYCNMMQVADETTFHLINKLKYFNLWNDTILIFTTDNGGIPNVLPNDIVRSGYASNLPYRGGKFSLFEGGIKGVGFINGGYLSKLNILLPQINSNFIHCTDWFSTILSIANINQTKLTSYQLINYTLDSIDMLDSIFFSNGSYYNDDDDYNYKYNTRGEIVFAEEISYNNGSQMLRYKDYKLIRHEQGLDGFWNRTNLINIIDYNDNSNFYNDSLLFNLKHDPFELENLYYNANYSNIVSLLETRLNNSIFSSFRESDVTVQLKAFFLTLITQIWLPFDDVDFKSIPFNVDNEYFYQYLAQLPLD